MPKNGIMIHDILELFETVFGCLLNARNDSKVTTLKKSHMAKQNLDFVTREEFDAAFAILVKYRNTQEELKKRLSTIEAKLNLSSRNKRKTGTKLYLESINHSNHSKRRA